ncbi:MAG: hypothetical protein LBN05_04530 [Oscillospiraceae bacterium]|jgi:hypothetical protein|nr:hypothetical protein [Oscillospiraceae bacterium]
MSRDERTAEDKAPKQELTFGYLLIACADAGAARIEIYQKAPFLWPFFEYLITGITMVDIYRKIREEITYERAEKIFSGDDVPEKVFGEFNRATRSNFLHSEQRIDMERWEKFVGEYYHRTVLYKALIECCESCNIDYLNSEDILGLEGYIKCPEKDRENYAALFFLECIRIGINRQIHVVREKKKKGEDTKSDSMEDAKSESNENNKQYKNAFQAMAQSLYKYVEDSLRRFDEFSAKFLRALLRVFGFNACLNNEDQLEINRADGKENITYALSTAGSYGRGARSLPKVKRTNVWPMLQRIREKTEGQSIDALREKLMPMQDFLNEFNLSDKAEKIYALLKDYIFKEFSGKQQMNIITCWNNEPDLACCLCAIMLEYVRKPIIPQKMKGKPKKQKVPPVGHSKPTASG